MPAQQAKRVKSAKIIRAPVAGPAALRQSVLLVRYRKGKPDLALMLTAEFRKEGEDWLAECLETGTATFGPSFEGAWADFVNALTLQFDGVERLGFLDEYLEQHHIRPIMIVPPRGLPYSARGKGWVVPGEAPKELVQV